MKIERTLTTEELKTLSYFRTEDDKIMTEADFKEEIFDYINHRLVEYVNRAKTKLACPKTITQLEEIPDDS